ncbi:MAG: PDZ domain-containing protein, partial [Planctomycetota bacterium]
MFSTRILTRHSFRSALHLLFGFFVVCASFPVAAQNQPSGGMMRFPDVSAKHIVFVYADDLWIVDRNGGVASPLASPQGRERVPRFSPDGQTIAFTGDYEGDRNIYTIPVTGGVANRMTYHPGPEVVCDWMPDGKTILFVTNGFAGLNRQPQLFTISSDQPLAKQMPVPYGTNGTVNSDGTWLAYTPHSRDGRTWKRYRGGMASDVWLFNLKDKTSKQITDFEGTDSIPMWNGTDVYYLSDNGPESRLNIWKYSTTTGAREQITKFKDFDCKSPSIGPGPNGGGEIVFSNGADLKLLDLTTNEAKSVTVTIPGDRPKLADQRVDASNFITSGDISPKAKRVCVEARGDIWTLPAKQGVARNLTRTDGVAERSPSWSPDGRWIAYFSDKTGEYELYVTQSDGRGETKQLTKDGKCFRFNPTWSPDSKHIVFSDKTGAIYLHTIGGETKLVDTDPYSEVTDVSWSHESQWLAYELQSDSKTPVSTVYIYNVAEGKRHQVTSGFFNSGSPVFDREGKFLYLVSSRAFDDPDYEDVGTTFIYQNTEVILAVPLRADVELPMQPESDEEEWEDEEKDEDKDEKDEDKDEKDEDKDEKDEDKDEKDEDEKEDGESDEDKSDKDDDSDEDKGDDEEDSDEKDDEDEDSDEPKDPLTGTWALELKSDEIPAEQRNAVMTLEMGEDGSVTGSVDTPGGEEDIDSGSFNVETGELKFEIESEIGKIKVTATVKDGKLTGTVNMGGQEVELVGERSDDDSKDGKKKGKKKSDEPFKIDFENIARRTFQLPIEKGSFGDLAVNHKNQLIFARVGGGASIKLFDMHEEDDDPEEKTIVSGTPNFALTADGKKMLVFREESGYIVSPSPGQKLDKEIPTKGMKVMISPREEWKQVFTDAWRIERDFFYDPNMHGVDWKAMHDHYAEMLKDCSSRADVGFVIGELISELNVGHAYYRSGDDDEDRPEPNRVGLLGCTFEIKDGKYTIGTIFEGAEWDTDARNPLRTAGIKEGEFLLAINDRELTESDSPYEAMQGTVGTPTILTISEDAKLDDEDRRIVVKPMRSDNNLRFRHW